MATAKVGQQVRTWITGGVSPYELHDITRRPNWRNIIVWDAYFNNLAAGMMVITGVLWLAGPKLFTILLPWALSIAMILLAIDLLVLIFDLGDPFRFTNSLRLFKFLSPLSLGVWALSSMAFFLSIALFFVWLAFISAHTNGFLEPIIEYVDEISKISIAMALISAGWVICYKGTVFSCTSQPGIKNARWLTSYMVSDALVMGMGVYAILMYAYGLINLTDLTGIDALFDFVAFQYMELLVFPTVFLIGVRTVTLWLLWLDLKPRAVLVYSGFYNFCVRWYVYLIAGLLCMVACFVGPLGQFVTALLNLIGGMWIRYWIIGMTKRI